MDEKINHRNREAAALTTNLDGMRSAERQRQEKFMRLLLENSPDMIILLDHQCRFAYCTNAFLKKAHIRRFDLISGRYYKDVFERFSDKEWMDRIHSVFQKSLDEKTSIELSEKADIGKDGKPLDYSYTSPQWSIKTEASRGPWYFSRMSPTCSRLRRTPSGPATPNRTSSRTCPMR
jgi:PAS domain-containing protein